MDARSELSKTDKMLTAENMQEIGTLFRDGGVTQGTEPASKRVHFPPISETVQLTLAESQFKPQPPFIRSGSARNQRSYRTAHLDQTMSKHGRVVKLQQRDTLKGGVFTPVPPNTLPGVEEYKQTPERIFLPPILDKVQGTHHQTQTKIQQRDTLKGGVFTPVPPNTLPGVEEYKQTPERIFLPPILDKVQGTHRQTQMKSQPRDTLKGGVLPPVPPNTLPAIKTSPHTQLDQTRSIYGRVLRTQERDTLKGTDFPQDPPNTLSGMMHVHLPPINDKVHRTHRQTRSKFQQGDTLKGSFLPPCQTNTLPAIKTSPHIQLSTSTVEHGSTIKSKHVPLPPIRFNSPQTALMPQRGHQD
ncbi:uncharacterized protein LOC116671535 [Etheostoma spectabile]|uniref:uncharacterized protein LOC116671535 n=1 Tax=Etheostoma spectabile TaxID=54343 RepID=UPI0013AEB37F|nr:uncharacterized protein LOC116671535 [Etheostoma spectabile]